MLSDKYNLIRFLNAQEDTYQVALKELQEGRKRSHCMWFIFPPTKGLGTLPNFYVLRIGWH